MKKGFIALLILVLCAFVQFVYGATSVSGRPAPGGAVASLLFSESFNGASDCDGAGALTDTNCDNTGWTAVAGTVDYSGTGIRGLTYSMTYTGTNGQSYHAFTGHTGQKLYAAMAFEATTGNAQGFRTIGLYDADGNIIGYSNPTWSTDHYNMRLYYYNNLNSFVNATCTVDINDDEVWYVKLEYTPGTGTDTNGAWALYVVQDNDGFPGWGEACLTYTTSASTVNAARVYPARTASATQVITIQGVKIDVSDITY